MKDTLVFIPAVSKGSTSKKRKGDDSLERKKIRKRKEHFVTSVNTLNLLIKKATSQVTLYRDSFF